MQNVCEVTGSSRSYVITDGAQKELIKPFYTFTDCVCSLLCDIGPGHAHTPVRYTCITCKPLADLCGRLGYLSSVKREYRQSLFLYQDASKWF